MDTWKTTPETLVQDIERLQADTCPERFRYTHEFLQLAWVAAQREGLGGATGTMELVQSSTTH